MRICLVYDCLYPYSIGGAERWYRNLAERLVDAGHEVTFLTLRQWDSGAEADVPGVRVVAAGPRMSLYADSGRRRVLPPILFGLGVLVASPPPRPPVRRRSLGVVPVLLAPGDRRDAQTRRIPGRGRLARGVDAGLLARIPRPARRSVRLARAAPVPSRSATRLLLLQAARAPPARPGPAWRADAPGRAVRRTLEQQRATAGETGRRLRGPPDPREAGHRLCCRHWRGRGNRFRTSAARSTATVRSERRC